MSAPTRIIKIKVLINQYEKENQNDLMLLNSISVGGDNALIIVGIILTISPLFFIGLPLLIGGIISRNKRLGERNRINHDISVRNEKIALLKDELLRYEFHQKA